MSLRQDLTPEGFDRQSLPYQAQTLLTCVKLNLNTREGNAAV